jgi:DNA-binding response OmpR family regulator
MEPSNLVSRLKIVVALGSAAETMTLQKAFEDMGHRVESCKDIGGAVRLALNWQPDLVITDESLGRGARNDGLRLAELSHWSTEQSQGSCRAHVLVLITGSDWDRIKRARATGAHVIVKSQHFDVVLRYVQTVADNLITDRKLGPVLIGIHRFHGESPMQFCCDCNFVGASLAYGASQTDIPLTPVRATLLNTLFFYRRGLSPEEIEATIRERPFLTALLKRKAFRKSAIKMEITRLRRDFDEGLRNLGIPYRGEHFLPFVSHGYERYRLAGNWQLTHVPIDLIASGQRCSKSDRPDRYSA